MSHTNNQRDAEAALREGRYDECESICRQILAKSPNQLGATVLLGISMTRRGAPDQAVPVLQAGTRLGADSFEAWMWLGLAHKELKQMAEAVAALEKAVRLAPGHPTPLRALGLAHLEASNAPAAVACLREATLAGARDATTYHQLAVAYTMVGDTTRAIGAFKKALALEPSSIDSWVMLGNVYLETAMRDEAIEAFLTAHRLNPGTARGQIQLARAYREQGRIELAQEALQRAREIEPENVDALELVGNLLQQMGRFDAAKQAIERAIEIAPERRRLYANRTSCARITEEELPFVRRMESLLASRSNTLEDLRNLHYSLGKAYDDLGDPESAMKHFDQANAAMRSLMGGRPFDLAAHRAMFDRKIETYTPELFERNRHLGSTSARPILIVGMIRSGTSLTEQVLSSHPEIAGGGELPFWFERSRGKIGPAVSAEGEIMNAEHLREMQAQYVELLSEIGQGRGRTTDKMPHNYLYLGDIHLLFPNAKIIHCRRNPADNCVSIYTTPYRAPLDFAHDKINIASVYREYRRLMEHWRSVLPPGTMLEVDYEALVDDREGQSRRMIEFLGLPWDDACLSHEANDRVVRTPSLWQVRQPIYRTSVERWRRFEPWIAEFVELLEA